jgi:conjugative relaxase-like TrwC/TraI family protein
VSLAKISAGKAEKYYYEKDAIFNKDEKGENLLWGGEISRDLNLIGQVDKEDFKNILEGKIGEIELRNKNQKTSGKDRDALDLVFSAPKSVSHAALALDKKDIIDSHNKAVKDTMKFVESLAELRAYNKDNKRKKEETGKLLYATALHSTSRAVKGQVNDMSLHSHNIIMNTTQAKNGKMVSLNTDKIFQNQGLINKIYKENLANNLKNNGYGLSFDKQGNFEIAGYERDVIDNFSKRKFEINEQVKEMKEDIKINGQKSKWYGKSDKELRDYAQHNFKSDKTDISEKELKEGWDKQHKENGIMSKEDLLKAIEKESLHASTQEKFSVEKVMKISIENLTDKSSYVSKEELLKEMIKVNQGDNSTEDLAKSIDDVKKIGQKEGSDVKRITLNHKDVFTTKEIYDVEKENRKILMKATKSDSLLTKEEANKGLDSYEQKMGWKMTDTQREAAFNALTTNDKFSSVQGDAGTGKTTFLDAVRHSLEYNNQNSEKLGVLAPTGKASQGAQAESGIQAKTVDSYLIKNGFDSKKEAKTFTKEDNLKLNDVFKDKKFQIGGGAFGLAFNKDNQISTLSQNKSYDKTTQSFKHTKTETIKNGEFKGSTKKSSFEIHGDTKTAKSHIKLNDGREMKTETKEWNIFKDLKTDSILSNKSSSFKNKDENSTKEVNKNEFKILGFSRKTESIKIFDKEGKLQETKAKSEMSFMRKTFTKETKADDKEINNRNIVSKDNKVESMKTESYKNNDSLKNIDKQLDNSLKSDLNNSSDKKMIFVDESSMLSSKKLNSLLKDAEEKGHKIMFIGDTKQLLSVQQGKAFNETQELTKTTTMNQGMRQRSADAETKKVVDSFAKKDVSTAIDTLDKQRKFKEMDSDKRVDYVANKLATDDGFKNTIALASTKTEVREINDKTREKIFGEKDFGTKTNVLEDKRLDLVDKMKTDNYSIGDKVSMKVKNENGKERFATYEVKGINKEKNELLLSSDKKSFSVNVRKEHRNITQVEAIKEKSFAEGDKVMNLKNDSKRNVMNGEIGYVKSIDEKKGTMEVSFGKDKTVSFDLKDENKHLDHAYAMSIHKSQGVTEEKVIAVFDTKNQGMNNQNLAYVASSRHKKEFELLTDDKNKLKTQINKEQEKHSTTDSKDSKNDLKEELKADLAKNSDKYNSDDFKKDIKNFEKEFTSEKESNSKEKEKDSKIDKKDIENNKTEERELLR